MNIQDHTLNGFLQSYGDADFDIDFAPLERFPERKYVIRTDTDEAIGVVGKGLWWCSHPQFFGQIRGGMG